MPTTLTNRTVRQSDWSAHIVAQTLQDEIPTNPEFQEVHLRTSGTAVSTPTYEQSSAITSTGQPRDNIKTGSDLAFELGAELSYQHKVLMAAALESAVTDNSITASTIASDANGFIGSVGTEFDNISAGDFIFMSGFTDTALNRAYLVTVKNTGGDIEVNPAPASVEAEGASVTLASHKAALGQAPTLYAVQNRVIDESQAGDIAYETFYNGFTNTYALSVPESGIITATLAMVFEKKNPTLAPIAGQTDAAPLTSSPSTTPLISVWLDGALSEECFLKTIDLNIEHGYTGNAVAQCEQKRQAKGIPTIGGSLATVMYSANTYLWKNKADTGTPVDLAYMIDFKDGKYMIIHIPRLKPTSWSPDGDTALANSMDYSAEADRATNIALYAYTNF